MKRTIEILLRLVAPPARVVALLLAVGAAGGAWAGFKMTNPVTGKEETYTYKFVGTTHIWNGTQYWQNSEGANPSAVPGVTNSNLWDPILFDASVNSINITAGLSVEGWNLRMGLYKGANVKLNNLQKLQGNNTPMWITVDGTSQCTIGHMANAKLVNSSPLSLYSAKTGGIAWSEALSDSSNGDGSSMPFHYYLTGTGSVAFNAGISVTGNGAHVIKQADVTLTGTSQVSSKTLVSFTSSTKTFTADAAIKVYDTDGTTLKKLVGVTAVRQSGATIANTSSVLTTADAAVGTCEIVQCTNGIVLYYVDGAPSAVTGYTPSININFTNGNGLTTAGEVGLSGYAVPGMSWNNFTIPDNDTEQNFSTVAAIDSTGAASTASGVSVSVSGHRGVYRCSNLDASSNPLHGYVDEGGVTGSNTATPTVTITGIPYANYRLIVYHSTDSNNLPFGYDTINGTNFTYVDGVQAIGTTSWGNSGASDSANAIAEGVNTLVSGILSGSTATMVAHRVGTADSASVRGCFAAIQVVEVVVSDTELVIPVAGATTYAVDADKEYEKVIISGTGTLTLDGTGTITTDVLEIENNSAIVMNSSRLAATAVIGKGTAIYDGEVPPTDKGWTDSANWTGTVWIKNYGTGGDTTKVGAIGNVMNNWGNAKSFVKFTNVRGWCDTGTLAWTLILEDDSTNFAWYNNNGYAARSTTFAALKGSGTFYDKSVDNKPCRQKITFTDGSQFTGALYAEGKRVGLGGENTSDDAEANNGTIEVVSGATATVASGKTWTAGTGSILVAGTLYANGTLAGTSTTRAVRGSGTVVFTGSAPSPTGDAWWKNSAWTGTVWIKSHAIVELDTNLYGNEGSTLKFTGVTGYFAQNHVNTVPIELENSGSTAAFNYNNGWGGELLTFSELKGTGTLQTSSAGNGGTIWVKKWDTFTGVMNLGLKQVVMGGDEPDHSNVNRNGKLVIAEGAVVTNLNATTSWTASGGIEVNGTFAASDRTAWADGTAMTINSTGILNMYGSGVNDTSKSFANVTGTGTIWYSQTSSSDNTKYSTLPSSAANMFANTLSVSNDNSVAGVVITMNGASDVVTTNANVSGTGYFRSDWNSGTYRGFLALQSKNTTWSGTFGSSSRLKKFIVAGVDGATDRTLTLAGTQSSTIPLTIESLGSVNITGTYLGATTVSGEIGGTGTLTGDLTFNAGATFKAFASDENGLAVSGTVTCPAEGKVTVDVSALEQTGTKVLMTASGLDDSKFALASGQSGKLSVDGNALKVSFSTYVASYGGKDYETIQEAIDAAVADGHTFAEVTILDPNATCPAGYYVDTENSNALTKYQAAYVLTDSTVAYYKTAQLAVEGLEALVPGTSINFDHFEVYDGSNVAMSMNPAKTVWAMLQRPFKVKCLNGATVAVTINSVEFDLSAGDPDENGIVTYTKTNKATTYVWVATSAQAYARPNYWKVGSAEGATATRTPDATDTVVIGDGASLSGLSSSWNVAALRVSGTVTFIGDGGGTLTSASAITLGASDDSITITGTLSPTPTTSVADSYVKATTSGSTTTYEVDTYKTITITGSNMTTTRTDTLGTAIKDGDTITFTIAPAEGYVVTGVAATPVGGSHVTLTADNNGVYSYVVNGNVTIAVSVVAVAEPSFDVYYAGYGQAKTVTVAASDYVEGSVYTLQVGNGAAVTGVYENGKVTFADVTGFTPGAAVNYTITVSGAAAGTKSGTVTAAAPAVSGWVNETKTTIRTENATGTWSPNAPNFGEADRAALSGETTFTANSQASGKVTLTTVVNFGNEAAPTIEIGADAKAAIKVENNSFKIWTKTTSEGGTGATADWLTVSDATPDLAADSTVVFTFDTDAKTFTVSVDGAALYYGESNANTSFAFASDGVAISSVAYKGAGSFTSLTGAYATTDVTTSVDGKQVVVANSFISGNAALRVMTVAEAAAALAPDATPESNPAAFADGGNGINYFKCYALGLDPTKTDDKPIVDVTTDAEGKFVFTVKHPVYNEQGEITGYEEINAADNVSTTVALKYGTDAEEELTNAAIGEAIAPAAMFSQDGLNGSNVIYYKAEVTISAK